MNAVNQPKVSATNPPANPPVAESAIEADIKGLTKFISLVKAKLKQVRQPAAGGAGGSPLLDAKMKKLLVVAGVVVALFAALLITAAIYKSGQTPREVAPTPIPTPAQSITTQEVEIINPSRYATDSAVLSIESDLKAIEKEIVAAEIKETRLTPPALDFEIKF